MYRKFGKRILGIILSGCGTRQRILQVCVRLFLEKGYKK